MIRSPFMRQLYVATSPLLASISSGGAVCFPMVLLHQLQANDTSIEIDFDTASWMGSIHGLAGIPSIFMPSLMQWKGRKFAYITTCLVILIGWILAYTATTAAGVLLSESFHGFGTNSLLAVSCLTMTEMMSPDHRDTFIQFFYILQTMGMASDGLLTQYLHWKTISIIMLVPVALSVLVAFTLPESPYWLAYKGEITKCEETFIWLRGSAAESIKEMNELKAGRRVVTQAFKFKSLKQCGRILANRDVYIPAIHMCVLQFLIHGSGSIVTLIYAIVMLEKSIRNESISSFGGLIMNSLFCIGICISIISDRYFAKKPVLLWSVVGVVVSLITASAFSFSQSVGAWPKESLVGLYCLSVFMLSSSVGIIGLAYPIASVLMPVKYRGIGGALLVINTCLYHAMALKSAPYMFLYLDMWGTYLVYSAVSICCGLLIWKYIPETKGKSLQEIQNYYSSGNFSENDRVLYALMIKNDSMMTEHFDDDTEMSDLGIAAQPDL